MDDVGFGHAGSFGGAVPTPPMARLASHGLRYNTFHTTAEFIPVEPGPCKPADVRILINDKEVGKGHVARMVAFRYGVEPLDIVMDTVSAVSEEYKAPFPFPGRINQVAIEVK